MGPWSPAEQTEWWPYPILDFVSSVDVAPNSAQPLLLTATPSPAAAAAAGNYSIVVTLTTPGQVRNVTLQVEIYDIDLPPTPSLPIFWGVAERDNPAIWPV